MQPKVLPTQVQTTYSISTNYDRLNTKAFEITVKSSSAEMQEIIAAKLESLAKIYFVALTDEKSRIMFAISSGPTYYGTQIRIKQIDIKIESVKRFDIIKYLDAIPKVGATVEDVERVFQTIPK